MSIEGEPQEKSETSARPPIYLVFEGVDGAGKSTLAKAVAEKIPWPKKPAFFAFPSHSGEVGKLIRRSFSGEVRFGDDHPGPAPYTRDRVLGYLMIADGLDREHEIRKCLARRTSVVCDRHPVVSSWVYQAECWRVDVLTAVVQRWQFQPPHATIILDVPAEVAVERMKKRGIENNPIYEQGGVERFELRRRRYAAYAAMHENVAILDGTKTTDELLEHLTEQLKRWEVIP